MPWMEYKCPQCGQEFKRLILLGETPPLPRCPGCGASDIQPSLSSSPLFEGISNASQMAGDHN